jgi:hypothetical protein
LYYDAPGGEDGIARAGVQRAGDTVLSDFMICSSYWQKRLRRAKSDFQFINRKLIQG